MTCTDSFTWVDPERKHDTRTAYSGEQLLWYYDKIKKGEFGFPKKIVIPREVVLDHRLTAKEKLLAGLFFTYGRFNSCAQVLASYLGSVNACRIATCVSHLRKFGYIQTHQKPMSSGGNNVYTWIGPNSDVKINNKRWTKNKSADVANQFLLGKQNENTDEH